MKNNTHLIPLAYALDAMDAANAKLKRIINNILIGIASVAFGLFFNGLGPYGPDWLPRLY
jgi:hypothetical protein